MNLTLLYDYKTNNSKGIYDVNHVWPKVGCVGVAQTDYVKGQQEDLQPIFNHISIY